jgi:hypothetical protein
LISLGLDCRELLLYKLPYSLPDAGSARSLTRFRISRSFLRKLFAGPHVAFSESCGQPDYPSQLALEHPSSLAVGTSV